MNPLVTIEDLLCKNFPEQTWLVDGLIPTSAITIFSGEPSSYKTWVTLHTAICVAAGKPVFGKFETSQCGVLVIDEEDAHQLLQPRLFMLQATADLPIYFSSEPGFTLNDESVDALLANCTKLNIKLVIIDSLVRVHASDENSAGDMAGVFKQLRKIAAKDVTVLVTHHNRKQGANSYSTNSEMRGSSDILASVDCHISTKRYRNGSGFTMHQRKNRYAQELEPFEVQVSSDGDIFRLEYQGDTALPEGKDDNIKSAVLKLLGQHDKLFQKEILGYLGELGIKTNEHKLRELLKEMTVDAAVREAAGLGKTKYYSLTTEAGDEQA